MNEQDAWNDIFKPIEGENTKESNIRHYFLQTKQLKQHDKAIEILVDACKEKFTYKSVEDKEKDELWIFSENLGIYEDTGETKTKEYLRFLLKNNYTVNLANKVIERLLQDYKTTQDLFFNRIAPFKIPVKNGLLNVKTKEITKFETEPAHFANLPVTYDPSATCPTIEKHLQLVMPDKETIQVFYEICGWCLIKNYRLQKMIMFTGEGSNGKSETLDILNAFLGHTNVSSINLQELCEKKSFLVVGLHGKLANIAGDIPHNGLKQTDAIKKMSGGDLMTVDRKFRSPLQFVNYAKMLFSCNRLPKSYDMSHGFFRRWLIIEFPKKFKKPKEYAALPDKEKPKYILADPDIGDKLTTPKELSGLLNKALEGVQRLLQNKDFSQTESTAETTKTWIRKSDSFAAYAIEHLESSEDDADYITKRQLRVEYQKFCKKHKLITEGDKHIKEYLNREYAVTDQRKQVHDDWDWCWIGLKIKTTVTVSRVKTVLGSLTKHPIAQNTLATLTVKQKMAKLIKDFNQNPIMLDVLIDSYGFKMGEIRKLLASGEIYEYKKELYKIKI